ncbi:MAG TPA: preprotein translocase subunit YajC [Candidatus Dojkabacteria bacterium]|nr:preprotein translocase subunit YajC [Candidatus Dojkabacteria bacterium]
MGFFTSIAYAATGGTATGSTAPGAAPAGSMFTQLLPLIFIIVIFYFLLIRPQQQKQKAQRDLINSIQKGDHVVTIGGIHGTVVQVSDDEITLEVSKGVNIRFVKSAVSTKK